MITGCAIRRIDLDGIGVASTDTKEMRLQQDLALVTFIHYVLANLLRIFRAPFQTALYQTSGKDPVLGSLNITFGRSRNLSSTYVCWKNLEKYHTFFQNKHQGKPGEIDFFGFFFWRSNFSCVSTIV